LTQVVSGPERLGFALQSISADGLAHRYTRTAEPRPVAIDVLAPEGLGERADLTTTPPGRTIEVPGGTQALGRTEKITVVHEGRSGPIPRPNLLAAIVGKAAATALPGRFEVVDQMTRKDRQRLRLASKLLDNSHPAWALLPAAIRSAGQIAYGVLHG